MGVTIKDLKNYTAVNNIDFGEKVIFFKFGAKWCIPCIELEKILTKVDDNLLYHISIDNEEFESFFMENKIYTVPDTIIKYKDNTRRFQGVKTIEQINEIINSMKENN
jgi:thiol-disulfide isomerase/thioredoxin